MIACPRCRHELKLRADTNEWACASCSFTLVAGLHAASSSEKGPYLGDQLMRNAGHDCDIEWSPDHEEPRLNCWMDIRTGPDGTEELHYMLGDADYIQDHIYDDWVNGGHFYRYAWTAENQIIIQDGLTLLNHIATAVHETHERYRMKYLGWRYERAHASARVIERAIRNLALEKGTVIPNTADIEHMLVMEGQGMDCLDLAKDLFEKEGEKATAATKQANATKVDPKA